MALFTSNHHVDEQLIEVMPEFLKRQIVSFVLASARSPLGMQPTAHKQTS